MNVAASKVQLVLAINTDAKAKEVFREAIDKFTASHPDISVQLLEITGDYYQKLLVMIAGKTAQTSCGWASLSWNSQIAMFF